MHVLISGGSGFIGRALVPALLAQGHRVSVLTRDATAAARVLPTATRLLSKLDDLHADAPQVIVNLAGENIAGGRWTRARKAALLDSRLAMTERLVAFAAAAQPRPRALISASAIGWYGATDDRALTEQDAPGADFAADLCRRWEQAAMAAEPLGLRVCRLRIGLVLGRDGGSLAKMLPAFRLGLGGVIGDGRQWMSWIHRDDLVALLLRLIADDNAVGVYNGTAPQPVTNADFTQTLARTLRRPALLPMPAALLRLLLGELAGLLLTGQRVLPQRALAEGFTYRYASLDAALRALLKS